MRVNIKFRYQIHYYVVNMFTVFLDPQDMMQ